MSTYQRALEVMDEVKTTRPKACDVCAEGKLHRAHCKTFPITCNDMIELWDEGYRAALQDAIDHLQAEAERCKP